MDISPRCFCPRQTMLKIFVALNIAKYRNLSFICDTAGYILAKFITDEIEMFEFLHSYISRYLLDWADGALHPTIAGAS